VKLVGENPQALLEGEPALRRGLIDWNVFHVEPRLGALRSEFRRVLLQRNAALRARKAFSDAWDAVFVDLAEELSRLRSAFVADWSAEFGRLAAGFQFLASSPLRFDRGWPVDEDLATLLVRGRSRERERGQTLVGPHRADIRLGDPREQGGLSRGQTKVAVCLMQLSAEYVHRHRGLAPTLWLLDDVRSELDGPTWARLATLFDECAARRLTTCVGTGPICVVPNGVVTDACSTWNTFPQPLVPVPHPAATTRT
jgi:DNA replication and repair protein RecF